MRIHDAAQKARKNVICRFTATFDRIRNITVEITHTQAQVKCFVFDENGHTAGARCKKTHPSAASAALLESIGALAANPLSNESAARSHKALYAQFNALSLGPHDVDFNLPKQISALWRAGFVVYRAI
jgi:hypothetical protein